MSPRSEPTCIIGRYAIYDEIASGGMASVHFGRLLGSVGFSRTVAIKRLHAHLAKEPDFVRMFLDEARVAARIHHPNVVSTLDVVSTDEHLFLVMEYVHGESLFRLTRAAQTGGERVPLPVACAVVVGLLQGLHAAHEATNERGDKLGIVHRDVSPQNVIVGSDGIVHVVDFGVAKAADRLQTTRDGQLKGKLAYMAPEQVRGKSVTRAADIYSAGVVLWELLTNERLFVGSNEANVLERVLFGKVQPPSTRATGLPPALDEIVMRAVSRDPALRFATAREMARAIEVAVPIAAAAEVSEWLEDLAGEALHERQRKVTEIESNGEVDGGEPPARTSDSLSDQMPTQEIPVARVEDGPSSVTPSPASDLSGASAEVDAAHASWRSPAPRRRWALAIGAGALVPIALIVVLARRDAGESSSAAVAPSAASTAASASAAIGAIGATTMDPVAPTPTAPTASAVATAAPAQAASTELASEPRSPGAPPASRPPATARPRTTRAGATRAGAAAAGSKPEIEHDFPGSSPPAPKPNCNPPYTIDSQGVKQYKIQCL